MTTKKELYELGFIFKDDENNLTSVIDNKNSSKINTKMFRDAGYEILERKNLYEGYIIPILNITEYGFQSNLGGLIPDRDNIYETNTGSLILDNEDGREYIGKKND